MELFRPPPFFPRPWPCRHLIPTGTNAVSTMATAKPRAASERVWPHAHPNTTPHAVWPTGPGRGHIAIGIALPAAVDERAAHYLSGAAASPQPLSPPPPHTARPGTGTTLLLPLPLSSPCRRPPPRRRSFFRFRLVLRRRLGASLLESSPRRHLPPPPVPGGSHPVRSADPPKSSASSAP
jgi:hypothetical protein